MEKKFLALKLIVGLIALTGCSNGGCPIGPDRQDIDSSSGNITGYDGKGGKCEWRLSSTIGEKVVINITFKHCESKFKLDDKEFCGRSLGAYIFLLSDCGDCNNEDACFVTSKDHLKVTYDAKKNSDRGFTMTYEFKSCTPTTTASTPSPVATPTPSTSSFTAVTSRVAPPGPSTVGGNRSEEQTTSQATRVLTMSTTTQESISPPASSSSTDFLFVFVPIVVILVIIVLTLLIIMKIRRHNLSIERARRQTRPTQNSAGTSDFSYESIENKPQSNGINYRNQAYETVISVRLGGAIANKSEVYRSAVAGEGEQNGRPVHPSNTYDQVAGDETQNAGDYEVVSPEGGSQPEKERIEVENVLYGEN